MTHHEPSPFGTGGIIHAYTREQALADGVLIELDPELTREAGIAAPVDLTTAAHAAVVAWGETQEEAKSEGTGQDETGRAWDVLTMLRLAAPALHRRALAGDRAARVPFSVLVVPPTGAGVHPRMVCLHAVLGGDDLGRPLITVMLPTED
ncbi:DUF6573 family protein [Allobranchiibius huperziae]|uniref:Uncharacterized protein n=1 Tax=Allobranchiibius huperziae TaxID=1874116 RepID=A0A853DQS6_9MICO|nr:DUF6573 family protein [Allobranchiibius huperziae]NYJ76475.1 hypothetical protein [Allobranchiibius huperziae]